nr:Odorant-binding protein A10 [Metisa plana]
MKVLQLLIIFSLGCGALCQSRSTYTTKYDEVDLEEILANDRLLTGYVNCLLERGRCTPDGRELKENLPDAIENGCSKCSDKQKLGSELVMRHIIDHRPDDWAELEQMYNPDGSYRINYLKEKLSQEDESGKDKKDTEEEKNGE